MISRITHITGVVIVVAVGLPATVYGDSLDAEKRELIDKGVEPWNAITRWLIEYEAIPSATTQGIPVHRIMAVAAPGSFYHLSAHFPPANPWQVDPFCQEYFINDGRTCHRWPFNRTYAEGRMKPGDDLGGTIALDVLLTIIPRWPLTEYKTPTDPDFQFPLLPIEVVRSAEYRLLPDRELIAGESCVVFDRMGLDRIWIAAEKGICVMRREFWNPNTGRLGQRILVDKVTEVAPGLWLPAEFRSQFFSAKRGMNETIEREYGIHILRCALNDHVASSVFTPIHRPGSLKFETASQCSQVSPEGDDLLSDIIDFMVTYAHLPTEPIPRSHPIAWFLGGLAGGLCAFLIGFVVPVRFRREKSM